MSAPDRLPGHDTVSYLDVYLAPLLPILSESDVTDIYINQPGELWIERLGGALERREAPALDDESLWRLTRQIASLAHQGISREHPLLSATLPDGSRVQIVAPPATRGPMAIAIRRHVMPQLRLDDYVAAGAFDGLTGGQSLVTQRADHVSIEGREAAAYLQEAVRERRTILISGGTSSGKTTFLNALLKEVPLSERLILIEDTPELSVPHPNAIGLCAVKGALGEARVTSDDLLQASLRMRPDRIILGELRGSEAYTFLRAINTGHPGSMTTIHADSPQGAIEQLALIIMKSGVVLQREDVVNYVRATVDVFVQLVRRDEVRGISVVLRRPSTHV